MAVSIFISFFDIWKGQFSPFWASKPTWWATGFSWDIGQSQANLGMFGQIQLKKYLIFSFLFFIEYQSACKNPIFF